MLDYTVIHTVCALLKGIVILNGWDGYVSWRELMIWRLELNTTMVIISVNPEWSMNLWHDLPGLALCLADWERGSVDCLSSRWRYSASGRGYQSMSHMSSEYQYFSDCSRELLSEPTSLSRFWFVWLNHYLQPTKNIYSPLYVEESRWVSSTIKLS